MGEPIRSKLLVSVRSADEARAAVAGGAALIDVKEPARGSLGRADADVVTQVVAVVGGRRPVSAALGEWADESRDLPDADLAFVKWGLAGCRRQPAWRQAFAKLLGKQVRPRPVLVAYADWQCAEAPSVEEVFALASEFPGGVMLVDTYCKAAGINGRRPTLLDWLPAPWLQDICARARAARVKVALAGCLGWAEIKSLLPARPDWFAVRGAVCDAGNRQSSISVDKVHRLAALLDGTEVYDPNAHPAWGSS